MGKNEAAGDAVKENPAREDRTQLPEALREGSKRRKGARFVMFSDTAGVYLGPGNGWSMAPGHDEKIQSAPTVANDNEAQDYENVETKAGRDVPEDIRLVEIVPDLPNDRASVTACSNVQLPRWNE